jgi:hypothetical protein
VGTKADPPPGSIRKNRKKRAGLVRKHREIVSPKRIKAV